MAPTVAASPRLRPPLSPRRRWSPPAPRRWPTWRRRPGGPPGRPTRSPPGARRPTPTAPGAPTSAGRVSILAVGPTARRRWQPVEAVPGHRGRRGRAAARADHRHRRQGGRGDRHPDPHLHHAGHGGARADRLDAADRLGDQPGLRHRQPRAGTHRPAARRPWLGARAVLEGPDRRAGAVPRGRRHRRAAEQRRPGGQGCDLLHARRARPGGLARSVCRSRRWSSSTASRTVAPPPPSASSATDPGPVHRPSRTRDGPAGAASATSGRAGRAGRGATRPGATRARPAGSPR